MVRPAKSPVVDSGAPKRAEGLPNTAAAAILLARSGASGGAEPISPMVLPTGGTPASMATTAPPCEKPPKTKLVAGHWSAMKATWPAASFAPFAVVRKLILAG